MGLRERKKERTSRAIEDAALELFAQRGFHATTIADIAEAADIAPRTFFAYFPSKESVLFGDFELIFDSLIEQLDGRGAESLLDALRAWIVDQFGDHDPHESKSLRRRVIDANGELLAYERTLTSRFEGVIAAAAADEFGCDPADLHPRLVGAAAAAVLNALRPAAEAPAASRPEPQPMASLDDALAFLGGGIGALHARREQG